MRSADAIRWLRSNPIALAALALLLLAAPAMLARPSQKFLDIVAQPAASGTVQVYFDQGAGLSEELSTSAPLRAGRTTALHLAFPPGETRAIRLDPPARGMVLKQLAVRDDNSGSLDALPLASLQPLAGVAFTPRADGVAVAVAPGENDPQIGLRFPVPVLSRQFFAGPYTPLLAMLLVALLPAAWAARNATRTQLLLTACGGAAFLLSLVMALMSTTAESVHPDEALHWADATYFASHWLPPRLDDPALLPSLASSPYGISYLFKWNVGYFFAGKVGAVASAWGIDPRLGFRMFNLGLLLVTMAALARYLPRTMAPAVMLLTPQLWYVFSYFNGDAFPLAASLIAMAVAVSPRQEVQRFLATRTVGSGVVLFVLAMAALILSKENYLPVVLCCLGWLAVTACRLRTMGAVASLVLVTLAVLASQARTTGLLRATPIAIPIAATLALVALAILILWLRNLLRDADLHARLLRFTLLLAAIGALAAPWIIVDAARNGMGATKRAMAMEIREHYAAPAFRPSALAKPSSGPGSSFMLAAKGAKLGALLNPPYDWATLSFRSFFGVYGFMTFFGSRIAYLAAGMLFVAFLFVSGLAAWREQRLQPAGAVLSLGLIAVLVGASFLHSWAYDFQAQGRYLLGGLAMTLPLLGAEGTAQRGLRLAQWWLLLGMFGLGVYSFIAVGLRHF